MNEEMQDSVKVTVIATGFQPEYAPAPEAPAATAGQAFWSEPATASASVAAASASTAPAAPVQAEAAPEPVVNGEPEPPFDPDDLETPAYLRQGRLLN